MLGAGGAFTKAHSIPLVEKIPNDENLSALEEAYLPRGWLTHWQRLGNLPS